MAEEAVQSGEAPSLWPIQQLVARRLTLDARPAHQEQLLIEPISDTATTSRNEFGSYLDWENDHSTSRRFYVVGVRWLRRVFRANQQMLVQLRGDAHRRVKALTSWSTMEDPKNYWDVELGRPQILNVFHGEPVAFAKGAQFLMTCEIFAERVLAERVKDRTGFAELYPLLPAGLERPEHIHRYMGLLPACWNIDGFTVDYARHVSLVHRVDICKEVADAGNLRNPEVAEDLTQGYTVTRRVAERIHQILAGVYPVQEMRLGRVRAKPGRQFLGRMSASQNESPELG